MSAANPERRRSYPDLIRARQTQPAERSEQDRLASVRIGEGGLFAKLNFHPKAIRLTTLAYWKDQPEQAEFFGNWPADSDRPTDRLFGGSVTNLEPTSVEYDPDDSAPWKWNLAADLFAENYDWGELLAAMIKNGPGQ